jgi:hypothetical protein
MLTDLHALAALDADHGLGSIALGNDLDAGVNGIGFLIECLRTGLNALQACHTFGIFLNSELLHNQELSFVILLRHYYTISPCRNQPKISIFSEFFIARFLETWEILPCVNPAQREIITLHQI